MMGAQFDLLIKAKLGAMRREMRRELNASYFDVPTMPYTPPSWRERIQMWWMRVKRYTRNVVDALKGHECDCSDY